MVKIEITSECADQLVKSILIKDYQGLKKDITRLEQKTALLSYEEEDLANSHKVANAMEVLLRYYLVREEAEGVINETTSSI